MDEPTAVDVPPTRRRVWWLVAAGAVALLAVVLVVFQPQRLFLDTEVNESLDGLVDAAAPAGTVAPGTPTTTAPTGPVVVSRGSFVSVDHPTSGEALLVRQPDGTYLVRFEGLQTDNGPDLKVALSAGAVGSGDYATLTQLGELKGNVGDQNYPIPAEVDLSGVQSVVIWCERFAVAFGEAPLSLPPMDDMTDDMTDDVGRPVHVGETPYGPALVDAEGLALYTWDQEPAGTVTCTGECADKWPPLIVDAVPTDAPGDLDPARIGLLTRPDGTTQLTIDGRALYRMAIDEPGEANCQGGDGWFILNPDGSSNRSTEPI